MKLFFQKDLLNKKSYRYWKELKNLGTKLKVLDLSLLELVFHNIIFHYLPLQGQLP